MLTPELASKFAALALGHVRREYPYKPDHVLAGPEDAKRPSELHPIFHGSFDWHSCVHGFWLLLRLLREYPDLPEAGAIRALADEMMVPEKVAGEVAYLARPTAAGFERPYGWGWLLKLHAEAAQHDAPWVAALEPLARAFAARFHAFLPKLTYAIRVGTHFNTSFALTLADDWAATHDPALRALIGERARAWFTGDRDCQAWEPGGDEFLSSALCEVRLMQRVLGDEFEDWFANFLPRAAQQQPASLFTPAVVSDRSDGKIVHLDGLNLSRAWCWKTVAGSVSDSGVRAAALDAADRHIAASLPHVAGDYMGEHWLATFALLALMGD
ncbi:DUF2891 domain-containing protein [Sphingoaurantiacus capsulatus]|uniref:DUF2891 domain-containing protein n=1 Tax=Sphingoaurantiacus capsulatus TaxID=1771310 RepID=A0ABV7X6Y2_9SPHN